MGMELIYSPPHVRVSGEDILRSSYDDLAKIEGDYDRFRNRIRAGGTSIAKHRQPMNGGKFDFSKCRILVKPIRAEVVGTETQPIYQVLRSMQNNAPRYVEHRGFYMPLSKEIVSKIENEDYPENWVYYGDKWWRPARLGEGSTELSFKTINDREQSFEAGASYHVENSVSRTLSNEYSAGTSFTVKMEFGGEASVVKGGFEWSVNFQYTHSESNEKSHSEGYEAPSGLTVALRPGEARNTVFTAKKGIAHLRVLKRVDYDGDIGVEWDMDVDIRDDLVNLGLPRRARKLFFNAKGLLNMPWREYWEDYKVTNYTDGVIGLDAAE